MTMSASHIPHIQCVYQIGIEKHRMLDLFIQVPAIIRKRLSRRCKDVYETVRAHVSAEEVDEGTQEQVWGWHPLLSLSNSITCLHFSTHTHNLARC